MNPPLFVRGRRRRNPIIQITLPKGISFQSEKEWKRALESLHLQQRDRALMLLHATRGISDVEPAIIISPVLLHLKPTPPAVARRFTLLAALAAVEPEREEEWREILGELAATGTRQEVVFFALGILYAGLHSRVTWMARTAARPGTSALCWVLRSQVRTRALMAILLFWAGVETVEDTGLGAAILLVLTGAAGLELVAEALRTRFEVTLRTDSRRPEHDDG